MKGTLLELMAAVATAAAPAITKMSVAAVRRVEGMAMVGRGCEADALWRAVGWSIGGSDTVDS